jgi:HAD superfamily hydrolase (TIGR01509 family)
MIEKNAAHEDRPAAEVPGAALWDLDGTLIDSAPLHWIAWRETMAARDYDLQPVEFANSFGKRNDTILRGLLGPGLPPAEIERISDAKEVRYRQLVQERGIELLPGARAWLDRLKDEGWRQALATSAPLGNIDATLDPLGLTGFFEAVVSAEEVGRGKPDPLIFLTAAERLGVVPARCVVVEDAPAGLEGARRAGMRAIGVLSPHFSTLTADLVVSSLEALPERAFDQLLGLTALQL